MCELSDFDVDNIIEGLSQCEIRILLKNLIKAVYQNKPISLHCQGYLLDVIKESCSGN